MARTLIDHSNDVAEFAEYDELTGDLGIRRVQDVEPTVNAVRHEASISGGRGQSMWHVGSLPYTVWHAYGVARGLPENWIYLHEYAGEVVKLIAANPRLSPTGGKV